jgi:hypothetical protein
MGRIVRQDNESSLVYKAITGQADNPFEDFFKETPEEKAERQRKALRKKVKEQKVSEPYQMTLYRGFNLDPNSIPDTMVLDPTRSEQGLIWFTHIFVRGYNPVEYAKNHGTVLLTYSLACKRHSLLVDYDDGSQEVESDPEMSAKAVGHENSRFLVSWPYCIELPEGWFFTYKNEKFIGCSIPLTITKQMLSPVVRDE